jgi:EmrB/QacA subfamily drug resistance transporter
MEKSLDSSPNWGVLVAIGVGTFMTALDTSVANTVLPIIGKSLNQPIANVEWVVTIYLLVMSGLLLSFGRLGDMRGHKSIYLTGFGIFIFGSLLSGIAPNIALLIAFRGLQAFGAAMLAANSPAILTKNFPAQQRGQALGLQATMTYLGLTVGPSLGGWLASLFGWRVVFYINVPVGLVFFWLGSHFIPRDTNHKQVEKFDYLGAITFMLGLGTLLLGLNQGGEWGWTSVLTLLLLSSAVFILLIFIYIERHVTNPMLDLSLFNKLPFSLSTSSAVLNYIGVYSSIFLMPYYLIQGRGFTPAQAGMILTAQPLIMAVIAPISGTLSDRIGTRLPAAFGMAILSVGLFFLSRLTAQTEIRTIMLSLAIVGLGTGTFISPNNSALMGAAPKSRQGIAAGILATARNFGMVLGVGIAGAIFTTILARAGDNSLANGGIQQNELLFRALQLSFLTTALFTLLGVFTSMFVSPDRS